MTVYRPKARPSFVYDFVFRGTPGTHRAGAGPVAMGEWLVIIVIVLIVFGPLILKARKK